MEKISETIFEEREEMMISPNGDSNPTHRTAHFLKPTIVVTHHHQHHHHHQQSSVVQEKVAPFLLSSQPRSYNIKKLLKKINFHPSQYLDNNAWTSWVERLRSKHESTWKKAGIYEAILSSTYKLPKQNEVLLGVAEKWCPETNTFIFPWGEATISLEDMIVLGGFSVLGDSDLSCWTDDLKEAEKGLVKASSDIIRLTGQSPRLRTWVYYFDEKIGRGDKVEHQAFLYCWLSRYVFPHRELTIAKHLLPLAIHLARGTKIALAPMVLACIYKNLSALKCRMIREDDYKDDELVLTVYAPFQLVLVWIWERFPTFRPKPNPIIHCGGDEPRLARWHNVKKEQVENVRLSIDSEGENFRWRPYSTSSMKTRSLVQFHGGYEDLVLLKNSSNLDIELESLVRCIRVSELVGLDCIEQYLPHRVALQFGFDQDIPDDCVLRSNETREIAWSSYIRPVEDTKIYIPPRLFESDVTMRYFAWWRGLVWAPHDAGLAFGEEQEKHMLDPPQAVLGVGEVQQILMEPTLVPKQGNEVESLVISEACKCRNVEIEVTGDIEEKKGANQTTGIVAVTGSPDNEEICIDSAGIVAVTWVSCDAVLGVGKEHEILMERTQPVNKQQNEGQSLVSNAEEKAGANNRTTDTLAATMSGDNEEIGNDTTVEAPGFELELRIEKLEDVFSKLKDAYNRRRTRNLS